MPLLQRAKIRSNLASFAAGFILGSAFMASPAIGLVLAVLALVYLALAARQRPKPEYHQ